MQKNPEPKYPVGYNYRKGEKFRFTGFESDSPEILAYLMSRNVRKLFSESLNLDSSKIEAHLRWTG